MIYHYLKRRINRAYALLGALFFLTIPVIVRLSSTVYVDLGLICFLFASLLCLLRWVETEFRPKYLIISAVFCGLALGTKYNGLLGFFLLSLFVSFVYSRYHAGEKCYGIKSVGWCLAFIVISLIVFSPWMIRNICWTGNPVYPLYNKVFNPQPKSSQTRPDTVLKSRVTHVPHRNPAPDIRRVLDPDCHDPAAGFFSRAKIMIQSILMEEPVRFSCYCQYLLFSASDPTLGRKKRKNS